MTNFIVMANTILPMEEEDPWLESSMTRASLISKNTKEEEGEDIEKGKIPCLWTKDT